jgi:hypothetical protein
MAQMTVELHLAYLWTCDNCGRDNFDRAVSVPASAVTLEGQSEEVREWIESGESGDFQAKPDRVKCLHCSAEYDTEVP